MTSCVFIAGVCLVAPSRGRSVEEAFVAAAQAAEDTEGAMCLMPDGVDDAGPAEAGPYTTDDVGRRFSGADQTKAGPYTTDDVGRRFGGADQTKADRKSVV